MTDPIERVARAMEITKPIKGYEGLYTVSNLGVVCRLTFRNKNVSKLRAAPLVLKPALSYGYPEVGLWKDGRREIRRIHRLVLETFYGPAPPNLEAAHLNGDRTDNHACNLAWVTRKTNIEHREMHGGTTHGSRNGMAVLCEADPPAILADSRTQKAIAADYGVSKYAIWSIKSGNKWKRALAQLDYAGGQVVMPESAQNERQATAIVTKRIKT